MKKMQRIVLFFWINCFVIHSFSVALHPLIQAMDAYEHPKYLDADEQTFIEILKKYGSNIPVDKMNARLLHYAANNKYYKTVQILFAQGAQANVYDCNGNTPLHDAVFKKDRLMIKKLLFHGADPLLANFYGITPIHLSFENQGIEELLCKKKVITRNLKEKIRASL